MCFTYDENLSTDRVMETVGNHDIEIVEKIQTFLTEMS